MSFPVSEAYGRSAHRALLRPPSADRYRTSASSAGAGWPRSTSPRPQARPPGRAQGPAPRARRALGPDASSAKSSSPPGSSTPTSCRLRFGRDRRPALVHHALRRGRVAPRPADREKQLPVDEALRIAREVAEALDYAHARGDPPGHQAGEHPAQSSGHALVADFGIARALSGGDERLTRPARARHAGLHEPGAGGRRPRRSTRGPTSTPWAACSTRCSPASRRSPAHAAGDHRPAALSPRPIRRLRRTVPEGRAGAARALARVPADRFATAAEFARALEAAGHDGHLSRSRSRGRRRHGLAVFVPVALPGARRARRRAWPPGLGHDGMPLWQRTTGRSRTRARAPSTSPSFPSRTRAPPPTTTLPTAWLRKCAASSPDSPGSRWWRPNSSQSVPGHVEAARQIGQELGSSTWWSARSAGKRATGPAGCGSAPS